MNILCWSPTSTAYVAYLYGLRLQDQIWHEFSTNIQAHIFLRNSEIVVIFYILKKLSQIQILNTKQALTYHILDQKVYWDASVRLSVAFFAGK